MIRLPWFIAGIVSGMIASQIAGGRGVLCVVIAYLLIGAVDILQHEWHRRQLQKLKRDLARLS